MILKDIVVGDFVNYKKPSLFIAFPRCTFKCDKENGCQLCQNLPLSKQKDIEICTSDLIDKYYDKDICQSLVCGGLEPFDSFDELVYLIEVFRRKYNDDVVIYSGYTEEEILDKTNVLMVYPNIIVKFGRYRPNQESHFDELLGVNLANKEQYAVRIS